MTVTVTIAGEPCAQGRPRATSIGGRIRMYDPKRSRSWKGAARVQMVAALNGKGFIAEGPIDVRIRAYHSCPKSDYRKRTPTPQRWRSKRPDADQIVKATLDAATGVLWADDAQVARLLVEQFTAAQGDAPRVEVDVHVLPEFPIATGLM